MSRGVENRTADFVMLRCWRLLAYRARATFCQHSSARFYLHDRRLCSFSLRINSPWWWPSSFTKDPTYISESSIVTVAHMFQFPQEPKTKGVSYHFAPPYHVRARSIQFVFGSRSFIFRASRTAFDFPGRWKGCVGNPVAAVKFRVTIWHSPYKHACCQRIDLP